MMDKKTLILNTPSKINLFLKIVKKRSDGYHDLETIFLPLKDLYDTVKLSILETKEIKINSSSENIPKDNTNLCYKAAELYALETKMTPCWEIFIEKRIPVAGGMGGGSSDAAAVFLLLQKLYNNPLDKKKLSFLASKVGADVPFFLKRVPSVGYGIGDVLEKIKINCNFYVIICAPMFPVSAAWAYKNMITPLPCAKINIKEIISSLKSNDLLKISTFAKNDLACALYEKFPILSVLRDDLKNFGAVASEITGSGPTLFGICKDKISAEKVASEMKLKYGNTLFISTSSVYQGLR